GRVFDTVVNQVVIDFVADHLNVAIGRLLENGIEGFPRVDGAGGVVGGVEYDAIGVRFDGIDHRLGIELVVVFCMGRYCRDLAAIHADQWRIENEGRIGQDKVSARGGHGGERQVDGLGGAGGDQYILRGQRFLIALAVVGGEAFE